MNIRALICLLLLSVVVLGQPPDPVEPASIFVSQPTGGPWNVASTWEIIDGADDDGIPDADDIVVIAVGAGSFVSFPRGINSAYTCRDLYVVNNIENSIRVTGALGAAPTLTIGGALSGILDDLSDFAEPTVNVFHTSATNLTLIFNGSSLDDPFSGSVITSWGYASPIYRATFDAGTGNTIRTDNFATRINATVQSGTLQLNAGQQIQDFTGTSNFVISAGATLHTLGSINGGTTSTRFGTFTVNGTLTQGSSSYVNSNSFTLGATAILNIAFNGANQTQGWWYQSTEPTTLNLNPGSTVSYTANAAQNIYATTYGNLSLTSSSSVTKTLAGNGLAIAGNLMVGTNVTFAPSSEVEFTGTLAQSISGGGTLTFNGGLAVNKSSGTLTLSKNTSIAGLNVSAGILSLGNVTTTLSSGNVINDGTITSGTSGTLIVSGTSTFSGSGSLSLNNLTISGSTNISTNAWSITGNLVNNGSLIMPSTTTVTFTGGAAQSISGNAFEIGNMTVDKVSSTLSNNGNVTLLGVLTMTSGTFDADGSGSGEFILNSDPNGDARIGPMTGGNITGEVTFQRSFTNNSNRWRNLAFPVTDVTYAELSNSIELRTNSLATYTESVLGNVDQGWVFVSGGTLNSTRGHTAWMYDTGPITISVKGPLMQNVPSIGGSRYNFGVTYTNDPSQPPSENGWNFVPNPFASPINWNNGGWDKINVNAVAAIWDLESNTYLYSSGDEWDGVVAQGQAFWVQTNASDPVLRCSEDVKVSVSDPVFYKQAAEKSRLAVYLKSNQYTDKTVVQFREDATLEFDSQYDAYKLKNPIFNLSTLSGDGLSMAINNLPKGACPSLVKLNITNIEPGSYTLNFEGISGFEDVESVVLVDRFVDHQLTLSEGITYAFEVTGDEKSFGSSRFELHFNFANSEVEQPVITQQNGVLVSSYTEGNHQWFLDGTPIEGATQPTYRPTTRGAYTVEVSHKGCTLHSESILIAEETGSRAYPNPVSDELKVKVADLITDATDTGEIVFTSALGVPVKQVTFNKTDEIKVIDVRGIKPGQYFVSIIVNTQVVERFKIIVQ